MRNFMNYNFRAGARAVRRWGLALLTLLALLLGGVASAQANVTIGFDGLGNIDYTGHSEDGFTVVATHTGSQGWLIINLLNLNLPLLDQRAVMNSQNTGGEDLSGTLTLTKSSGGAFTFVSADGLIADNFGASGQTMTVAGFLNNVLVGTDTFNLTGGAQTFAASTLSGVTVDEVRITLQKTLASTGGAPQIDNIVLGPAASCPANATVSTEAELNAAIACFNARATAGTSTITLAGNINLTASTTVINNSTAGVSLVINGAGFTVDGHGTSGVRPFDIEANTTVTLNKITVTGGNSGDGGGIGNLGTLTIVDSTIANNTGAVGGGIFSGGVLTMRNSTVSGNTTNGVGPGGIAIFTGSATLDSVTITANAGAALGNGFFIGANATVEINNTIVSDNPGPGSNACSAAATSVIIRNSLLDSVKSECGVTNGVDGNIVGVSANLGPLANNGGPTQTHLPNGGSPVIDAGATTLATDQRGIARPQGAADDIGAVEVEATASGTIRIVKVAQPQGPTEFDFSLGGINVQDFTLVDDGSGPNFFDSTQTPGTYVVTEAAEPGWALQNITCDDANSTVNVATRKATILLEAGETVTCTFTNVVSPPGTIIIVKDANVNSSQAFAFFQDIDTSGNFSLVDDGSASNTKTFSNVTAGAYQVTELDPAAGWALTAIACNDANSSGTVATGTASINLEAGETVTCTFTNVKNLFNLTLVKKAEGGDATFDFGADASVSPIPNFSLTTQGGTAQRTFNNLAAGHYKVYEGPRPQGWTLTNIECVGVTGDLWSGAFPYAEFDAAPGDNITCTFTNTQNAPPTGTIIIRKTTSPAGGTGFGFTSNILGATSFTLNHGHNRTISSVAAGSYTVSENNPSGYSLTNLVCTDPTHNSTVNLGTRTATINLAAGETVDCTFTNSQQAPAPGKIKIVKDAQPNDAQDFAFTTTGSGLSNFSLDDDSKDSLPNSRTFSGLAPGSYSVTENTTPGWTLTGLTCTDPSGGTTTSGSTATINLAAGETVTCTFTNAKQTVNAPVILVSSNENGNVPGVSYRDEDIIGYDPATNRWYMIFDGSDVGLSNNDIDDFTFLPNGDILLSLESDKTVAGFGPVGDEDVLRFIPTRLGNTTAGSYQLYLDGSDVGLEPGNDHEDIKSVDLDQNGHLVVSVRGSFNALGITGDDEDLLTFQASSLGDNTRGSWSLRFDGSDIKLTSSSEDLRSIWLDNARNEIYITTDGSYSVTGSNGSLSGDGNDIFICTQIGFGANTACNLRLFRDMGAAGMGSKMIDGLFIGPLPSTIRVQSDEVSSAAADDPAAFPGDDADESADPDAKEEGATETATFANKVFLPLATR